jgi:hypothetical protein
LAGTVKGRVDAEYGICEEEQVVSMAEFAILWGICMSADFELQSNAWQTHRIFEFSATMHSHSIDLTTGLLLAIAIASLWIVSIIINRFFFHPLSNFPGPKLAITTYAHEWYYDLYSTGLTFKLKELHEQYGNYATPVKKDSAEGVGPVIRINPTDLHCDDPDYFDDIFNVTNGKADKPYRSANSFGPYPAVRRCLCYGFQ